MYAFPISLIFIIKLTMNNFVIVGFYLLFIFDFVFITSLAERITLVKTLQVPTVVSHSLALN